MCLTTNQYDTKELAIKALKSPPKSTKAIPVYKRLTRYNSSPYRSQRYRPGKLYTAEMKAKYAPGKILTVFNGLHAYVDIKTARRFRSKGEKIVRMLIPKGTPFLLGNRGDIVATKLKWLQKDEATITRKTHGI